MKAPNFALLLKHPRSNKKREEPVYPEREKQVSRRNLFIKISPERCPEKSWAEIKF